MAVVAASSAGLFAPGLLSSAAAAPSSAAPPLSVIAPAPQLPTGSQTQGAVATSQGIAGAVSLKPRNPAALAAMASAVSTPGSPEYRQYLAPGQFAAQFGPTPATVAAVEQQLKANGLTITSVSSNNLLVEFSGSASKVETAFHTHLSHVRLHSGTTAITPTSSLQLPATIAGSVQTVVGLSDTVARLPGAVRPNGKQGTAVAPAVPAVAGGPHACSAATTAATQFGGLTDQQIAHAYGVDGLYSAGDTGAGQTVAIYELEPFSTADLQAFDTCYFGATQAKAMVSRVHTVAVDGGQQVGAGSGEADLDVQDVSALAPGATIDVYEAPNTEYGALDNFNAIINQDQAKVISSSWGLCEVAVQTGEPGIQQIENTLFEQAAAQGQTIFSSAGDDGSDDCANHASSPVAPTLSLDDPASQPYVTSVGGTTIDVATNPPQERVWNDGANWGAGGGGISATWAEPSWQASSLVPGLANQGIVTQAENVSGTQFCQGTASAKSATACRETPDVSAQADEFTGAVTIDFEGQWITIGGTSSATPLWAAMLADINASAGCATSGGLGFADPLLYQLASSPAEYKASFNDITSGNNDVFGASSGLYPAGVGYDMASGLGSPRVTGPGGTAGLAHYACAAASGARPTVTSVAPAAVAAAGTTTLTVTGTGFENAAGHPVVAGVQIGAYQAPAKAITVVSASALHVAVPGAAVETAVDPTTSGTGSYDVVVSLVGGATSAANPAAVVHFVATSGANTVPSVSGIGASGGNQAGGNTVTVYGAGLTKATTVTFGGVKSPSIKVISANELTAVVPRYSSATTCATGTNPASDVCQAQVRVTGPGGTSATAKIAKPYTGAYAVNGQGVFVPPAGCGCEAAPAASEYDYLPTPVLTGITYGSPAANGVSYASEAGTTVATITGKGLGILGFEWADVGPPNQYTSFTFNPDYLSGTELQITLPPEQSTGVLTLPLSIQTLASPNSGNLSSPTPPSNQLPVSYAPVPTVSAVAPAAGPSTGGSAVTLTGTGFTTADEITFSDAVSPFSSATLFSFTVAGDTQITLSTPAANPGIDDVAVCTISGCSAPNPPGDIFTFFAPGNPTVTSVSPSSGPAAGGTEVTIRGTNLGFVTGVYFGKKPATTFANVPALLDSGSTTAVTATAPPGTAGSKVYIRVTTLESQTTGAGLSPVNRSVTFRY